MHRKQYLSISLNCQYKVSRFQSSKMKKATCFIVLTILLLAKTIRSTPGQEERFFSVNFFIFPSFQIFSQISVSCHPSQNQERNISAQQVSQCITTTQRIWIANSLLMEVAMEMIIGSKHMKSACLHVLQKRRSKPYSREFQKCN